MVRIKASEVMKARLDEEVEPIDGTNKKKMVKQSGTAFHAS